MNLLKYSLAGFNILANTTASIGDNSFVGVFNQITSRDNKQLGGYEPDDDFSFIVKTSDIGPNPKSLKGQLLVIDEQSYRIVVVTHGAYLTTLICQNIHKA